MQIGAGNGFTLGEPWMGEGPRPDEVEGWSTSRIDSESIFVFKVSSFSSDLEQNYKIRA